MTALTGATLADVGIDATALKPTETDLERAHELDVETLTFDYEGTEHVPDPETLRELAAEFDLRVTVPVRADGFDPRGDDTLRQSLPAGVSEVLVAGHPAYLSDSEQRRAVAPRLARAASTAEDPWVGTEGVERLALAIGGTQFELLSAGTRNSVRALRAAGFEGEIAVYAPTVLSANEDTILDAVGAYAARRQRVRDQLPKDPATDSTASGNTREILHTACREYALVGAPKTVTGRVEDLREAGVDRVVAYPASGLDSVTE